MFLGTTRQPFARGLGGVCLRRRNGSSQREAASNSVAIRGGTASPRAESTAATSGRETSQIGTRQRMAIWALRRSTAINLIALVCSTLPVMCGSGAATGFIRRFTSKAPGWTLRDHRREPRGYCAAGRISATSRIATVTALLPAVRTPRTAHQATSGSVACGLPRHAASGGTFKRLVATTASAGSQDPGLWLATSGTAPGLE